MREGAQQQRSYVWALLGEYRTEDGQREGEAAFLRVPEAARLLRARTPGGTAPVLREESGGPAAERQRRELPGAREGVKGPPSRPAPAGTARRRRAACPVLRRAGAPPRTA